MAKKPKSKPAKTSKKKITLAARTAVGIAAATKTAKKVALVSKATVKRAQQAPGAARRAIATVKEQAQAAGHMAEVAAGQATKVIATTAGVVAGIVEAVSKHEESKPVEPAKPKRTKKSKPSE